MADNYLEKKMEAFHSLPSSTAQAKKNKTTLNKLLLKNRSHRGYDPKVVVREDHLRDIVSVVTKIPQACNQQCLRYRLVTPAEAHKILPLLKFGAALPELNLPFPGTEPQAFIICCAPNENKLTYMDLGIAAQSMLLRATEMGLNGICIGAFQKEKIIQAFDLPLTPLLVLAIGKGIEDIRLTEIRENEDHKYYRENGVHYVPKVCLNDLLLG